LCEKGKQVDQPPSLEDLVQIFSYFKETFLVWTNLIFMAFGESLGKERGYA
jgi:hypothetical protein